MNVTAVKLTRRSGWVSASLLTAWVLIVTLLVAAEPSAVALQEATHLAQQVFDSLKACVLI